MLNNEASQRQRGWRRHSGLLPSKNNHLSKLHSVFKDIIIINVWTKLEQYGTISTYNTTTGFVDNERNNENKCNVHVLKPNFCFTLPPNWAEIRFEIQGSWRWKVWALPGLAVISEKFILYLSELWNISYLSYDSSTHDAIATDLTYRVNNILQIM